MVKGSRLYLESTAKDLTSSYTSLYFWYFRRKNPICFKLLISSVSARFCNFTSFKDWAVKPISTLEEMMKGFWFSSTEWAAMRCVLPFEIGFQIKHSQFCSKKDSDNLKT